jgi:transcriptional repressor OPI1
MAAQRILTLATESLDMMRGVTGVVKDSLDRAETWVGRLRVVGLQSGTSEGASESDYEYEGRRGDGESGYATPSTGTSSSKTITRTNTNTTDTSEWSVPSTPGEPADVDVSSPGADGAVVVSGIGGLSLGRGGMKERERKTEVEIVGMDVDA